MGIGGGCCGPEVMQKGCKANSEKVRELLETHNLDPKPTGVRVAALTPPLTPPQAPLVTLRIYVRW